MCDFKLKIHYLERKKIAPPAIGFGALGQQHRTAGHFSYLQIYYGVRQEHGFTDKLVRTALTGTDNNCE